MPVDEEVRISLEVLESMREMALRMVESDNVVLHYWGLHLLSDYRGLRLLAEKYA